MLGQLDRLMAMDLSHITLGIIPMGAELSMSPLNSFMLLDDLLVVESYGYEDRVGGDLAETHARIFEVLMNESATGERARRLITAAASTPARRLNNGGTMYDQPQPNYTTQPKGYPATPAHVVENHKQVD